MTVDRPVPRWLHVWAILTASAAAALLTFGGLVTTLSAGMADKAWPTQPWFLLSQEWNNPNLGYYVEHTHRLLGFLVGGVTSILALGLWSTDPRRWSRWIGLAGLVVLLAAFGQFHGEMLKQVDAAQITIPMEIVGVMAGSLGILFCLSVAGLATATRGTGLRLLGLTALVAVMIQGLMGGLRVRLHVLVGPQLALIHGIFAQLVFSLLVALAVLTAKRRALPESDLDALSNCRKLAILLIALVFVQLVWGAMVRHDPRPLVQRLHLLTAFAVVAAAVYLIKSAAGLGLGRVSAVLAVLLVLQLAAGVEAWMEKFASGVPPELQKVLTLKEASVRTLHVLIGSGILATSVAFALLTRRPRIEPAPVGSPISSQISHVDDDTLVCPALAGLDHLGGAN